MARQTCLVQDSEWCCKCGNDIHLTHLGGAKDVVCTQGRPQCLPLVGCPGYRKEGEPDIWDEIPFY